MHSNVRTAGEAQVALSPGRWYDIKRKRTLTECTSTNLNRPKGSSRFCSLALPIRDCSSRPAAKSYTPVISPFPLALCTQMVKNHLLCSHTCQQTVTSCLHIVSAINQIHYTLWSIPITYWISLLSSCKVGKKWTKSLKITEKKM